MSTKKESKLLPKLMAKLTSKGTVVETLLAYLVRGLGAVSLLWLYAVIAKRLPANEAGHVFLGLTVATVMGGLCVVGLQMLSLRLIAARTLETDPAEIVYLGRRTRFLSLPWAVLVSLCVFAGAELAATYIFQKPAFGAVLRWIAPSIGLTGVALVYSHQLQGLRRFTESLITLALGTQLLCVLLIIIFDYDTPVAIAKSYSAAAALNLVLAAQFWRRAVPNEQPKPVEMPEVVSSCFSFWVVKAMIMSVNWAGVLVVGILVQDPAQIALFAVAQRIANLVNFLLVGVNVVVTPKFARYWREQRFDKIRDVALKSTAAISVAALPIVLVLVLLPETFLGFFKPEYTAAATLLVILSLSQFFNVITGSVNQLLSMCEMEHDLRNIVVVSGIASIVLTVVLTSMFGVVGAAIASALALFIQNVAAVYIVKKKLGFSMFRALDVSYWFALARTP